MCLGDLTGVDFPGEKHPKTCPCDIARQKEQLDQERAERRREEERRREKEKEEEKREEQRRAVESKIEGKKRQFYRCSRVCKVCKVCKGVQVKKVGFVFFLQPLSFLDTFDVMSRSLTLLDFQIHYPWFWPAITINSVERECKERKDRAILILGRFKLAQKKHFNKTFEISKQTLKTFKFQEDASRWSSNGSARQRPKDR